TSAATAPRPGADLLEEEQRELILVGGRGRGRVDTDEIGSAGGASDVVPRRAQELVRPAVDTVRADRAVAAGAVGLVRARAYQERILRRRLCHRNRRNEARREPGSTTSAGRERDDRVLTLKEVDRSRNRR